MRTAFAGHPVASLLFFATLVVWLVIEVRQGLNRRSEARSTDRNSLLILRSSGIAGGLLAALALGVPATAYPYRPVAFGISLLVIWSGIGLRWWSFHTLGRYFTFTVMTSSDQPVIATGPYRLLRHPSYTGLLLILGGIVLTYGNWLSVAAMVVFLLFGLVYRIRIEEAELENALGTRYSTFASTRKRLIPLVW